MDSMLSLGIRWWVRIVPYPKIELRVESESKVMRIPVNRS